MYQRGPRHASGANVSGERRSAQLTPSTEPSSAIRPSSTFSRDERGDSTAQGAHHPRMALVFRPGVFDRRLAQEPPVGAAVAMIEHDHAPDLVQVEGEARCSRKVLPHAGRVRVIAASDAPASATWS